MNSLDTVHRRALVTASLTFAAILVLVFVYWRGVSKGSLPSPAQPLVQKPEIVATNSPPRHAVPVAALPTAPASRPSTATKAAARPESKDLAPTLAVSKPNVTDTTSLAEAITAMTRTPPKPTVSTNVTPEDQRVARQWLAITNDRPTIRVHYSANDVVRLTTDLGRALLVVGSGTTNRKEFYLEPSSKAPLFSPFSKAVAKRFANYSLALNPSPAFEQLTTPLPAYFSDGGYDLALVPDNSLATEIFEKVANAARLLPPERAKSSGIVFEGNLKMNGTLPVFEIVGAKQGTNQHNLLSLNVPEGTGN